MTSTSPSTPWPFRPSFASDEWKDTKFGFLGESRGGTSAMIVLRPFIESIVRDYVAHSAGAKVNFDASVGLYPAWIETRWKASRRRQR
jgi:hypothetical protein